MVSDFKPGDPCFACGSTDTFEDYPGCFECGNCHRRDDDETGG